MRSFPYVQLDVFTQKPLEGNQLAVFTDARGLSPADMQALARETRLSETTFIFPRDFATERQKGVEVRIFTVAEGMPSELEFTFTYSNSNLSGRPGTRKISSATIASMSSS